jgi:hypothetical protein
MGDSPILSLYKTLFSECFQENIELENEEMTEENSKVLKELEPDEVFENFKDLVKNLIEFKRFIRNSEENNYTEVESSNISTPAPEETQQYQAIKNFNEINEQLKREVINLQSKILDLEEKLKTKEDLMRVKDSEINLLRKSSYSEQPSLAKIEESEKDLKATQEVFHSRVNSEIIQTEKTRNKCNVIKSVKFEYFPSNVKKIITKLKPMRKKKNMNSTVSSPEKLKPTHSRSSSNILLNMKKLR